MDKEGKREMYEHIRGAQKAALQLGDFRSLSKLLEVTTDHQDGPSNIAETQGLFCIECHKPVKHS